MDSHLLISAAISGAFAGVAAILCSVAIEVFGGILGGVLGSIPTTIVPATIGFYLKFVASGQEDGILLFQRSVIVVPVGMVCNSSFLWLWKVLPPLINKKFPMLSKAQFLSLIVAATLGCWLVMAACAVTILQLVIRGETTTQSITQYPAFIILILGCLAATGQLVGGLLFSWKPAAAPKGKNHPGIIEIACRGVLAGLAIFGSVLLASVSPFAAGIGSIFPAIFLTAMLSVWIAQGKQVSQGAIGPLILGSTSVSVYSILTCFIVPLFSPELISLAFIVCWLASVLFISVPVYFYLKWRRETVISSEVTKRASEN